MNLGDPEDQSREWIRHQWEVIVLKDLGEDASFPDWLSQPAVSRETATSPVMLARLAPKRRKRLPYSDRMKPMNFVLGVHIHPLGYPPNVDRTEFRLIAPFDRDASKWLRMPWIEIHSGRTFAITTEPNADSRPVRVKSYGDVFADYLTHPEPKSASVDGNPCSRSDTGLLDRLPVFGTRVFYTGKESNRYEDVENEEVESWEDVRSNFEDPRQNDFGRFVVPILKLIKCSDLIAETGKGESQLKAVRNGRKKPSLTLRDQLISMAARYARSHLEEAITHDIDACAAFVMRGQGRSTKGFRVRRDATAGPTKIEAPPGSHDLEMTVKVGS